MFYDNGHMGGMHGWWWLLWLVLIAVVFIAAWLGWSGWSRSGPRRHESPQEILQRRLASGEITAQDYEQRKRLLDRDGSGAG